MMTQLFFTLFGKYWIVGLLLVLMAFVLLIRLLARFGGGRAYNGYGGSYLGGSSWSGGSSDSGGSSSSSDGGSSDGGGASGSY